MEFRWSGLRSRFRIGNVALRLRSGQVLLSRASGRVNGMERRNWEWCPRLFQGSAADRNAALREMEGGCAE
ncbi:hypothetical protein [Gramella sp. AN32]|uniref:Uncharacterized protein n=1 Tax=Christiangramia antarctica TaxID=2058158 RepID=A0ABW5X4J2_9FLAO|nr:hypothetical protein [Gramella sp. AN32]